MDLIDLTFLSCTLYRFQLKQEQENHGHTTMKYNTTREKLRRMEEQHQLEIQERQKVHRNLELELRTQANNMKRVHFLFFSLFFCQNKAENEQQFVFIVLDIVFIIFCHH